MKRLLAIVFLAALSTTAAPLAQQPAEPAGRVTGPMALAVDARDTPRKLLHATLTIPVAGGPLTLEYPQWIPGEHAPTGPISDLVGLRFSANGVPVTWRRDLVDMYAFHVDVPPGATSLGVSLDFLSAADTQGFSSAASETAHLGIYSWNQVLLYPQGARSDDVMVQASLQLPDGWKFGTALPIASQSAGHVDFAPVPLSTLVDSPVLAAEFFRAVPLDTSARRVELDMAADDAKSLDISADLTERLKRLVREADAMFGARHYQDYHFLLTLSDRVAHFGLEHHQSNDSRLASGAVVDETAALGVLPHEYVHSWNGKYRRPAGLATPDFQQPMTSELLWVYEGLTQYLGYVLSARSGLWSEEYYREQLAQVAAYMDHLPGREWRPLLDTAVSAQFLYDAPAEWASYRRGTDFYDEGWLIWLDVDTLIRERTGGRRSIEDFCRLFYGGESTAAIVRPYTFDEVVTALNQVTPYDWRAFLSARVNDTGTHAPLDGILRAGWRVVYNDTPNAYLRHAGGIEASYSIGLRLRSNGVVTDVIRGSAADAAGIGPGMRVTTVNGTRWSPDAWHDGLTAAPSAGPLRLRVRNDDVEKTLVFDYHNGAQQPHLERDATRPDRLAQILAPRAK